MKKLTYAALEKAHIREQFPKVCSCKRAYSFKKWLRLPGKKRWPFPWGEVQELRDCVCGSTMSIVVIPEPVD